MPETIDFEGNTFGQDNEMLDPLKGLEFFLVKDDQAPERLDYKSWRKDAVRFQDADSKRIEEVNLKRARLCFGLEFGERRTKLYVLEVTIHQTNGVTRFSLSNILEMVQEKQDVGLALAYLLDVNPPSKPSWFTRIQKRLGRMFPWWHIDLVAWKKSVGDSPALF